MASSARARESSPLYRTDYEDVTILGEPAFPKAPAKELAREVYYEIKRCREHLISYPDQPLIDPRAATRFRDIWVHGYEYCMSADLGESFSDLLWVLRSYFLCCESVRTRTRSELADLHELYVRMQLLATNHTRSRFEEFDDPKAVEELEQRCACIAVYFLKPDATDAILAEFDATGWPEVSPELTAKVAPLRRVRDLIGEEERRKSDALKAKKLAEKTDNEKAAIAREQKEAERQKEMEKEEEVDVNEGELWHASTTAIIKGFVRLASRVFRGYWLQKLVFDQFSMRPHASLPTYSDDSRNIFLEWFRDKCSKDYSDDSRSVHRDLVFEHWMPLGARQESLRDPRQRFMRLNTTNLLDRQLGVDTTTALGNLARVKSAVVCVDEKHETYEFLLLSQFAYYLKHKLEIDFMFDYFIFPGQLGKYWKRLTCKTSWNRPRRPILLRIMRAWWIHDEAEWVYCKDMTDALMKLMHLWLGRYRGLMADGRSVKDWVEACTSKTRDVEEI